ncbi:MAG: glycoside hydrolase family 15 protein [Rhodospirillales bacterium]|jgi:GH15 family glucan-1,4-alpha-glucosidase|nr:glycoside hydrolase family 15 protein [Rhodospirillales bacterium]
MNTSRHTEHHVPNGTPPRIEDYALIGDCRTAALVSRTGSIDWLCLPRFDSAACFAAVLDRPRAGRWRIGPTEPGARVTRRYRPGTLILETTFHTEHGRVTLIDFMPPLAGPTGLPISNAGPTVIRIVRCDEGSVAMRLDLALRFDYGSFIPWVTRRRTGFGITAIAGPDLAVLHSTIPLEGRDMTTQARFTLHAGQDACFVLAHGPSHQPPPAVPEPMVALHATEAFWTDWCEHNRYRGEWQEPVERSLITLKALTCVETGGIVAAPTTSLPELPGGTRNWDYRYCWLRDATFTLLALVNAGYREEARAWSAWLRRCVAGSPAQMRTLYGVGGERRIPESEIPWLVGYQGARPVRVGNAAGDQLQIDIYGEVVDALFESDRAGLAAPGETWGLMEQIVEHLCGVWEQPDESIWEVRGGRRHFVFSKVMAWVALDRAVRTAEALGATESLAKWQVLRARIHDDVCRKGFNTDKQSFVQAYGGNTLDASTLMIPLVGFLPATDRRMLGTVAAIERELLHDGLVLRYRPDEAVDGLAGGEGVFLACSFWLADNLALQGRHAEARDLFGRLTGLANDVGLLAEEYDPVNRRQLGNFPQAFSHLALIGSALNLSGKGPMHQRGDGRG